MSEYNIKIGFAYYVNRPGGKVRPLLIYNNKSINRVVIWRITSRCSSKSQFIKSQYFPLFHWFEYGLNKPSFVDIKSRLILSNRQYAALKISNKPVIGTLSQSDQIRFLEFIHNYKLNH